MNTTEAIVIPKESVNEYTFIKIEVLVSINDIRQRKIDLNRALILGNAYRRKVKLIFETTKGLCQVETTMWAVTEKNVILKGGKIIPIIAVHKVRVYETLPPYVRILTGFSRKSFTVFKNNEPVTPSTTL